MAINYQAEAAHIAAQHGIPKGLFLALVHQESGFNPTARSSAGAYGLTQLMPGTARGLGVNLSDPISQLEGGAKYLRQQFDRFGNWKMALAAYNAGPGNVVNGAWNRIPETRSYVQNILASQGKYGGIPPAAPSVASTGLTGASTAPQIPVPVLHGNQLNAGLFAQDAFNHLDDPGYTLKGLANGAYQQPFSLKLSSIGAPQIGTSAATAPLTPKAVNSGAGIVKTAMTQIGQPYQWGGEAKLGAHTDCSGLVKAVFAAHGITVPRTTYQQWRTGKPVPIDQLQPGDAVFFHTTDKGPSHVGIYMGAGKFINDPHTGAAVRIDNLKGYPGFVGARRFTR